MTIMSAQSIRERVEATKLRKVTLKFGSPTKTYEMPQYNMEIEPWEPQAKQACGMSYGLGPAGYDIRVGKIGTGRVLQSLSLRPGAFILLSSLERLRVPHDVLATVHDKSTLARSGLALQNTVLEPGWHGHITLELSNHGPSPVRILVGQPIAQVVFQLLDKATDTPYKGKYQDQPDGPVGPILEPADNTTELQPTGPSGDRSETTSSPQKS